MIMKGGEQVLDIFVKYWLQWIFGLIAAGIVIWAKHIIKLEKESVNRVKAERMKEMREEIVDELTEKIDKVEQKSDENDRIMKEEIEVLSNNVENLTIGVLSLQGKQFRDQCIFLLDPEHIITVDEYEQFEEDYVAYKGLGGNHTGDALHKRVVDKFNNHIKP